MAVELLPADPSHAVYGIIRKLMEADYDYLTKMQPQLDLRVVLAKSDKDGVPAVKLGGYPCIATIGIVPYKQRVRGAGDVVLTIDTAEWADLDEKEKEATIAHELEHLDFPGMRQIGEHLVPAQDKFERPIVSLKLHDIYVGGFARIVDKYGDSAIEKQAVDRINSRLRQMPLRFEDELPEGITVSFNGVEINNAGELGKKIRNRGWSSKHEINETFKSAAAQA